MTKSNLPPVLSSPHTWLRQMLVFLLAVSSLTATQIVYRDVDRLRDVPVDLSVPEGAGEIRELVLLCPGNTVPGCKYSFLVSALLEKEYAVAVIQYQLPGDPPLPMTGDLYASRRPSWEDAVKSIRFVRDKLMAKNPRLAGKGVVLIGHSNGGDIVSLCATLFPGEIAAVVAMDNRRMPVPRKNCPRFLSLRSVEFTAAPGVLPDPDESKSMPLTIETIRSAKHMDFTDDGPAEIREEIVSSVLRFLQRLLPFRKGNDLAVRGRCMEGTSHKTS
jgi:pimeloyl-ACP methyl ester carboxylesterase